MSAMPGELGFTKDHEWVKEQDDGSLLVGMTDPAQLAPSADSPAAPEDLLTADDDERLIAEMDD